MSIDAQAHVDYLQQTVRVAACASVEDLVNSHSASIPGLYALALNTAREDTPFKESDSQPSLHN